MKFRLAILSVLVWALLLPDAVRAQTLVVRPSAARADVRVASSGTGEPVGRDFATEVIGDPWDFEQASDYVHQFSLDTNPYRPAWLGLPRIVDGVFTGTSQSTHPALCLLFEGRNNPADGPDGQALNFAGRNGVRYPIDASRFRRLSMRVRRSVAPVDLMQVRWFNASFRAPQTIGAKYFAAQGYNPHSRRYNSQMPNGAQDGWVIYKVDLDTFDGSAVQYGVAWQGVIRGLEVALGSDSALNGARVEVDWVRLTERGTATVDLVFSGFGGPVTVTARHHETGDIIQIFPDNGTSATTFPDNSTFTWDYGFLPPGTWTITSSGRNGSRSSTLVLDPAPVVHVLDPDVAGGRDFARAVLGDAWDLTNPEDVTRWGRLGNMTDVIFDDSGLTATSTNADPFVSLFEDSMFAVGQELRVPADEYYRLSFTLEYLDGKDLPSPLALSDEWGAVYRVIWRGLDAGRGGPYTESKAVMMLDGGPHTFAMDLRELTTTGPGGEAGVEPNPPTLWRGLIGTLRIDPNEALRPRRFRLSNVRLAADDEPGDNGFFIVRWSVSDATFTRAVAGGTGSDATVSLAYNTSPNPAGRIPIAGASSLPADTGRFAWNVATLPPGTYWVFITVTDAAGNSQTRASTGPVRVRAGLPSPVDRDGDGMSDEWEARYGVSSPTADDDEDGLTNLEEFRAGTDPRVPNQWVLPEGATGFFSQRLALLNPNPSDAELTITYLREGLPPVVRDYTVAAGSRTTVDVNAVTGLGQAAVSAVVTASRGGVLVERTMFWGDLWYGGHTGKALQRGHTRWYMAEGDSGYFDTYILLANANAAAATATLEFLLEGGRPPIRRTYVLPPNSRTTVFTREIPGIPGNPFSTTVSSDLPITVERAMYFTNQGRFWNGGHAAAAVEAPATSWFVAEGCTGTLFDMYLLLANPNSQATTATVRYLKPGGQVVTRTYALPAQSRTTIWVDGIPGLEQTDVSASITAPLPIIVERAMYWPGDGTTWAEAHASAGVTSTGVRWGLAEGEHGGSRGFETYVLLANPGANDALVRVTLVRAAGLPPLSKDVVVTANSRLTLSSGQFPLASGEKFGVLIESTNGVPIVAERAMYWNGGGQWWGGGSNETAIKLR